MKIYNQEKTEILKNPDLEKGYLVEDKIVSKIIPAQEEVKEQFHYETIREYENGGKDVKKVVEVEYKPYIPQHEEYEDIQIYIPYTEKELLNNELNKLYTWFNKYDNQVKQYERCQRLDIEFDKDISQLDTQATINQKRISEIRNILKEE